MEMIPKLINKFNMMDDFTKDAEMNAIHSIRRRVIRDRTSSFHNSGNIYTHADTSSKKYRYFKTLTKTAII